MTQNPEQIFFPVLALILGTLIYTAVMGLMRVKGARTGKVDYRIFKVYRNKESMPDTMLKMSNHYDNLMTMPNLFYVLVTVIYVTEQVDKTAIIFAWAYLATRLIHSFVHLGKNHPMKRFFAFGSGAVILAVMTVRLGFSLVG
ncbi:MAG: MAPEG family protein [Litorimonas sp.]